MVFGVDLDRAPPSHRLASGPSHSRLLLPQHLHSQQVLPRHHRAAEPSPLDPQCRRPSHFPQPAPERPSVKPSGTNGASLAAKTARIDLDADEPAAEEGEWEVRENYESGDEEELEWTVRAKEEDLDKAIAVLEQAFDEGQGGDAW